MTDEEGNLLTAGKDYKLTGTVSAKKPGTYTIKAIGCGDYQIRYSLKSSMRSARTVTVGTKPSAVRKTVKKLKGGRKYYVQARAYKTVSGKKYYSAWSAVRSVKTK